MTLILKSEPKPPKPKAGFVGLKGVTEKVVPPFVER